MKTAIVTGTSSGIGKAIKDELLNLGYKVYGIGRNFENDNVKSDSSVDTNLNSISDINTASSSNSNLVNITLDMRDISKLKETINHIKETERENITLLINNAGTAYYGLHENLSPDMIEEMCTVNLTAPMIITNLLLKTLRENKGDIINISSVCAENVNPHGACYGATKAGLSSFSASLFEEVRKHGVRVIDIKPDMTDTALYRNADFTVSSDEMAYITPTQVAEAIKFALTAPDNMVCSSISIKPVLNKIERK